MRLLPKSKLLKRVESLEDALGLFYTVDSDGYPDHKLEEQGYSLLNKVKDRLKAIEEALKELSTKKGKK